MSSDVATKAFAGKTLLCWAGAAGKPVWQTGKESKFSGIPYIAFPGNVDEKNTLKEVVETLLDK